MTDNEIKQYIDKQLEVRFKKIEDDIRLLKYGSNNPFILTSLNNTIVELREEQKKLVVAMKKMAPVLDLIQKYILRDE